MNDTDQEIEVKFFVTNLESIEKRIHAAGAVLHQPRTFEKNLRFDTEEHDLEQTFRVVRLRQDERIRLTYKGPTSGEQGMRVRQEIEFEVGDFEAAKAFLLALGYRVIMIYEKYRTTYRLQDVEIVLDELPYGNFIEIEGPHPDAVRKVGEDLGMDWGAAVPAGYVLLFDLLRSNLGLEFRDLTFENFAGLPVSPEQLGVRPAYTGGSIDS